ncbi:hypothetical protein NP233_g10210 [Leucocoprinus birnbaumii]|uniref:Transmembrane protein n=1 Tax=Leucocoprinus birnbaumii TaxID=56174 RepID=A0AAD5YS40_9AGAR|nr:hypothetical protein NP233_g10210 [Leucocoprinus birnbaumii]
MHLKFLSPKEPPAMLLPFAFKRRASRVSIFLAAVLEPIVILTLILDVRYGADLFWIVVDVFFCVPLFSIFVHNILRLKLRDWKRCGRLTELILSLLEFCWLLAITIVFSVPSKSNDVWTDFSLLTVIAVMAWFSVVVQAVSTISSVLDIVHLGKQGFRQPYNISLGDPSDGDTTRKIEIFGAPTWAQRYDPESRYVRWARGTSAILCFLLAGVVGVYGLFYRPIETLSGDKTLSRHSWADARPLANLSAPASVIVVFPRFMNASAAGDNQLIRSLSVSVSNSSFDTVNSVNDRCELLTAPFLHVAMREKLQHVMALWCPTSASANIWHPHNSHNTYRRELFYTFDLPRIDDSSSLFSFYMTNITDISSSRDHVINPIMRAARGTLIWPGASLVGLGTFSRWDEIVNPVGAALGISNQLNQILLYSLNSVVQDPSPPAPQRDQSASLKVIFDIVSEDISVEQAAVEDTVVAGFSFVGGVWTFINGLFGLVFGCSLGFLLFGPFSRGPGP